MQRLSRARRAEDETGAGAAAHRSTPAPPPDERIVGVRHPRRGRRRRDAAPVPSAAAPCPATTSSATSHWPRHHDPPRGLRERREPGQGSRAVRPRELGRATTRRRSRSSCRSTATTVIACWRICRGRSPRPASTSSQARCLSSTPWCRTASSSRSSTTATLRRRSPVCAASTRCSTPYRVTPAPERAAAPRTSPLRAGARASAWGSWACRSARGAIEGEAVAVVARLDTKLVRGRPAREAHSPRRRASSLSARTRLGGSSRWRSFLDLAVLGGGRRGRPSPAAPRASSRGSRVARAARATDLVGRVAPSPFACRGHTAS